MSTEERNHSKNRYWTNIDGERYLQVEQFDENAFQNDEENESGEKNNQDGTDVEF